MAAHMQYGNRWSDIARALEGRSENAVKNHCESWYLQIAGMVLLLRAVDWTHTGCQ